MMDQLIGLLYRATLLFVRTVKWLEFQLLTPFGGPISRLCKDFSETCGVVFHFTKEVNSNEGIPSHWSDKDEKRVLSRCKRKYDKLAHIKVYRPEEYFVRAIVYGSLGSGEAYLDGWWEPVSDWDMEEFAARMLENDLLPLYYNPWNRFLSYLELYAFNLQTIERSGQVGKEHYDLGNDLYQLMLDPWMQYTCAYWAKAKDLNEAQVDKLELIAKKLDLKPGMKVLDIGCGFGMLCKYLAEKHGVQCVGVTISQEQAEYGRKANKGLPVEIRLQDYRKVNEQFDRVVSIGCMEHVGEKNYREFFQVAHRCLKPDGIFLMHSIGVDHEKSMTRSEPFLHKYIFPNGQLPRPDQITKSAKGLFILEDWHNFGPDYAKTLKAWRANFQKNWHQIEHKYGARFYRLWIIYLNMCVGSFRSRRTQLYQVVFSKDGLQTGYRAAR